MFAVWTALAVEVRDSHSGEGLESLAGAAFLCVRSLVAAAQEGSTAVMAVERRTDGCSCRRVEVETDSIEGETVPDSIVAVEEMNDSDVEDYELGQLPLSGVVIEVQAAEVADTEVCHTVEIAACRQARLGDKPSTATAHYTS